MKKEIIAVVTAFFVLSSSTVAFANENRTNSGNNLKVMEKNTKVKMSNKPLNDSQLKVKEGIKTISNLKKEKLSLKNKNFSNGKKTQKKYFLKKSTNKITAYDATTTENTDPNDAYYIDFGNVIDGNISVEGEQRWYNLSVDKKTRITSYLNMGTDVDFNLYLFKLDESTMQLNLVNYSENAQGQSELIDNVVDSGIYYIMVSGNKGSGNFKLLNFGADSYIDNELNDTVATATVLSNDNFNVTGTIDNPLDYDFYKTTLTSERMAKLNFTEPSGGTYKAYISTDGANFSEINSGTYDLKAGSYYFAVMSSDGSYSNSNTYNIQLSSVAYRSDLITVLYTTDLTSFFQADSGRSNFYVNGNPINFSYSYENHVVNSAGWIDSYLNLFQRPDQNVAIFQSEADQTSSELPCFVKYQTNFEGGGQRDKALSLTVFNTLVKFNRYAGGAYDGEQNNYQGSVAQLIIDIDTGKVIDVLYPNFYYLYGYRTYNITKPYQEQYGIDVNQ